MGGHVQSEHGLCSQSMVLRPRSVQISQRILVVAWCAAPHMRAVHENVCGAQVWPNKFRAVRRQTLCLVPGCSPAKNQQCCYF